MSTILGRVLDSKITLGIAIGAALIGGILMGVSTGQEFKIKPFFIGLGLEITVLALALIKADQYFTKKARKAEFAQRKPTPYLPSENEYIAQRKGGKVISYKAKGSSIVNNSQTTMDIKCAYDGDPARKGRTTVDYDPFVGKGVTNSELDVPGEELGADDSLKK